MVEGILQTQRLTQTSMSEPFPDQTPKGQASKQPDLDPARNLQRSQHQGSTLVKSQKPPGGNPKKAPHLTKIRSTISNNKGAKTPAPKLCSIDERFKTLRQSTQPAARLRSADGIEPPGRAAANHKELRRFRTETLSGPKGRDGGGGRDRTDDLKLAKLPLSQLSYAPLDPRRYQAWFKS